MTANMFLSYALPPFRQNAFTNSIFFTERSAYLAELVFTNDDIINKGDLNDNVHDTSNSDAKPFNSIWAIVC